MPLWVPPEPLLALARALAPSSPPAKVPPLESGLVPAGILPSLALSQMAPEGGGCNNVVNLVMPFYHCLS